MNAERTAEDQRGVIHWLRPDYQTRNSEQGARPEQAELEHGDASAKAKPRLAKGKDVNSALPKPLAERVRVVETALHQHRGTVPVAGLGARFKGAKAGDVREILETLVPLGRARREGEAYRR